MEEESKPTLTKIELNDFKYRLHASTKEDLKKHSLPIDILNLFSDMLLKIKLKNSDTVYWIVLRSWFKKKQSAALARSGETHRISKSIRSKGKGGGVDDYF